MSINVSILEERFGDLLELGHGAFGRVYRRESDGLFTAIKVLELLDEESKERFIREIDILMRVSHRHVVRVHDSGDINGHLWYESEFAELGDFSRHSVWLCDNAADAWKYLLQIARGLAELHDSGITHRDLKPSNVLVFPIEGQFDRLLKLCDLGSAGLAGATSQLTGTGAAIGTDRYSAPEALRNPRLARASSDIYSLGAMFLEIFAGSTLPSATNFARVPLQLRALIERMLNAEPEYRPASAGEVVDVLESISPTTLILGREFTEDERQRGFSQGVWTVTFGRELSNALEALASANDDLLAERAMEYRVLLYRLGSNVDEIADSIYRVGPGVILRLEASSPSIARELIVMFLDAADATPDDVAQFGGTPVELIPPLAGQWCWFVGRVAAESRQSDIRIEALLGLCRLSLRFASHKEGPYCLDLLHTVLCSLADPGDVQAVADYLRSINRGEIADAFDGVPFDRTVDSTALAKLLGIARLDP